MSCTDSDGDEGKAHAALAELCKIYWRPVFAFICRQGHSVPDAQDLTQDFFAMREPPSSDPVDLQKEPGTCPECGSASRVGRSLCLSCMLSAGVGANGHVIGRAAALHLDSLLSRLADKRYEPLREVVVKMLALSVWRERPDVKKIRATFGAVSPPDIRGFEHGESESFQPMVSYDFSLREEEKQ